MRRWNVSCALLCLACVGEVSSSDPAAPDAGGAFADAGPGIADADPGTTDGPAMARCYEEPFDPAAPVDDIVGQYGGADWKQEVIDAMARRWPAGGWLLHAQRNDPYFNQFSDSSSWSGMVGWLDTLVHEETHLFNAYHAQAQGQPHSLYLREDLIYYLPADPGFARSEILDDLAPFAQNGIYSSYLKGEQGQRKLNALLDELSCYANEVPGLSAFGEYFPGSGLSLRDGSAAFLYFLVVYLRVARTEYPSVYEAIQSSPVYREAIETLWLRTHFFYEHADTFPNLGIQDGDYRAELARPENLAELELLLGHPVDVSPCLPM